MKVDIIIPNYNGSDLIKNSLVAVARAIDEYEASIIVVDDASNTREREKLAEIISESKKVEVPVKLISHKVNKGFSSTVNTGVKNSNAEFVVLLNSDVLPSIDFLKSSLQKMTENHNLFAVGLMDESIEGERTVLRGRGIGKWRQGMIQHTRGEVDRDDTFWVSGGSGIFRRDAYEKLGGMDEIYNPFYWEDIDLSYRARKAGFNILFDNKSVVKHYHSEGAIKKNFSAKKITTIAYRNQFIFIWKNITSPFLLTNHLLYLPFNSYGAIKRNDSAFFKGLFLAVVKLPAIIKKRHKQKQFNKLSDAEIINNLS